MTVADPRQAELVVGERKVAFQPLRGVAPDQLPRTLRILLENALRHGSPSESLRNWTPGATGEIEVYASRVFLHDTNGVPVLADLAAMRDAVARRGETRRPSIRWYRRSW